MGEKPCNVGGIMGTDGSYYTLSLVNRVNYRKAELKMPYLPEKQAPGGYYACGLLLCCRNRSRFGRPGVHGVKDSV